MNTCLLPCRHVMYVRSNCNYETVIPPMRSISTRWIVHSPMNNIAEGDVRPGGLKQLTCPVLSRQTPLTTTDMYIETKALAEKIIDRMAMQSTPTYRVALQWLQDFYVALNSGDVVDFTDRETPSFPGLSQVSSIGAARLSQMSFSEELSTRPPETLITGSCEEAIPSGAQKEVENEGDSDYDLGCETPNAAKTDKTKVVRADHGSTRNELPSIGTKITPNLTEVGNNEQNSEVAIWKFAERPVVNGMTKEQRKKQKHKSERRAARELAEKYRKGKMSRFAKFTDVAALLDGAYSMFHTKAMVDALVMPTAEIGSTVTVRPFIKNQEVPDITQMLPLDKEMEGINAIKLTTDIDLLAYWPDYGCINFDQLDTMASIHEARNNFKLVMRTIKWLDTVEWRVSDRSAGAVSRHAPHHKDT
ncbi:Hypothetical protein PHPALM_16545 [Phytophthora palmivora]|uniref:Uncharacterized protein n=1 Tax=Phytophthora palmivora TaxID=4796 RepID=A0A2P4XPH4_9STRA|nr:Hypothetical protein PHPALM_16545 [Phytophthora palmivora]